MVGRAFLSQNVAIGARFGTFGVSVLALQDRYDSTRAEASMGLALAVLAIGLAGPLAASLIRRIGLRATMLLGAALSGRLGGARTLALAGLGYGVSWATVYATNWLPAMVPAMLTIGTCGAAIFPTVNVLAAHAFGAASLPRVLGYFGLFTLPLTFLLPPAAGALRDAAGNYDAMVLAMVGCCGFVALAFFAVAHVGARRTGADARSMLYARSAGGD